MNPDYSWLFKSLFESYGIYLHMCVGAHMPLHACGGQWTVMGASVLFAPCGSWGLLAFDFNM